jgi:prepilin-type N-terminal cleavage/methylation domain-containing protein
MQAVTRRGTAFERSEQMTKRTTRLNADDGFTLLEMMFVVGIVGVLTVTATAVMPNLVAQSRADGAGRPANLATAYRSAVVAGKGLSFTYSAGNPATSTGYFLFGTDGGVANFLRLLEDWTPGGSAKQINYRGSMVSLYMSRQAIGTFKCCERVYDYSLRNYVFDTDFLLPALLPPGTPMFRDVNTLTFRQLLRPNQ